MKKIFMSGIIITSFFVFQQQSYAAPCNEVNNAGREKSCPREACGTGYRCMPAVPGGAGPCVDEIGMIQGFCGIPSSASGLGGGRGVIASKNKETDSGSVMPCMTPAVAGVIRIGDVSMNRALAPAVGGGTARVMATPGVALGGVFGPRVDCGAVNADGTGGRKYCSGATPVCCVRPSNSVGPGQCGAPGCPRRVPPPPPPPPVRCEPACVAPQICAKGGFDPVTRKVIYSCQETF